MAHIMTVRGPIPPYELGLTSMHEHVLWSGRVYRERYLSLLPEDPEVHADDEVALENLSAHMRNYVLTWDGVSMHDEEVMRQEVSEFKTSGGSAMVDMSTPGLRSNLPGIRRISEETGVHIITTTGLYAEDSWPQEYAQMGQDEYRDYMKDEIDNGIAGTGIGPGHLKIAITDLTIQQERILRAAVHVSNETGYSLTVHPGYIIGSDGRRIVKIMKEEGMRLERAIIAHTQAFFTPNDFRALVTKPESWTLNLDYARELLDQGANLSVECFGQNWNLELRGFVMQTDWQRMAGVLALIKEGYSPQLVLGTDTFLKIVTRRYGGEGYCRLTEFVLPTLKEFGVSDFDLRQITIENPPCLLAIE